MQDWLRGVDLSPILRLEAAESWRRRLFYGWVIGGAGLCVGRPARDLCLQRQERHDAKHFPHIYRLGDVVLEPRAQHARPIFRLDAPG